MNGSVVIFLVWLLVNVGVADVGVITNLSQI